MNLQPVLRDALRPLLRRKGVTSIILITLALGVGVNVAIFPCSSRFCFRSYRFRNQIRFMHCHRPAQSRA